MLKPGSGAQISRLEGAMEIECICRGDGDKEDNEDMEA